MIAIGSDHGGFTLKEEVSKYLQAKGYEVKDVGCYDLSSVDYPAYGHAVGKAVASGECEFGIVICTTGIGISIAANKVKGVRCALCSEPYSARMTREHNNANVLAMGGGLIGTNMAFQIVDTFLNTEFSVEEKHHRRVNLLEEV
ncbi:MAG: ribose 5-phosphate isomerase B [Lachnospiraceae bacterium]|nr:ribose 5-phosphate isomerase B [Lachnospiraceae bacterium]